MRDLFPKPDFEELYGFSALHKAVLWGGIDSVNSVLTSDPLLIEKEDNLGKTPLQWAARRGDEDIVRYLLAQKADCNHRGCHGATPLHSAVASGRSGCVKMLLRAGANPSATNWYRGTALHYATLPTSSSLSANASSLEVLLDAGCDINAIWLEDTTPLHQAIQYRPPEMAEALISRGADISAKQTNGSNALSIAVQKHRHSTLRILLQHGADHKGPIEDFDTFTHLVAHCADIESLRLLVVYPLKARDINIKNSQGLTPVQVGLNRDNADAEWRDLFTQFLKSMDKDAPRSPRRSMTGTAIVDRQKEEAVAQDSAGQAWDSTVLEAPADQPGAGSELDESDAEFEDAVEQVGDLNLAAGKP